MIGRERIAEAPESPGVYLMKGEDDTVLYVGKARHLRKRVASYFRESGDGRPQIRFLMARVREIEYLVTDTEKEALLLENTLIKKHRPRYNIDLRDDKTYFSLRLDPAEEFPRFTIIRKVTRDGARYFGPYSSAAAARQVLKQLCRLFPLRHYPLATCRKRRRPCLYHQLGQCSAPCHGLITPKAYGELVNSAILFLSGRSRELLVRFRTLMQQAALAERYEEAARFRDIIRSIEVTTERQKVVTSVGDADVVGFSRQGAELEVCILGVRGGAVSDTAFHSLHGELEDDAWLEQFLTDHYCRDITVPPEIILPLPVESAAELSELLTEYSGHRVRLVVPARGVRCELLRLASMNAEAAAERKAKQRQDGSAVLEELARRLSLETLPRRIECYDISNFQGAQAVGSCVVFSDGRPDRGRYRRYRIRTVEGADDFAMMREVLGRRFRRGLEEGDLPDLVVLDGGPGQLAAVLAAFEELGVSGMPVVALAKSRVLAGGGERVERSRERIFLPGRKNPLLLRPDGAPLLLLARIRDEAHRFAVGFHRKVRGKELLSSALDQIPGVGAGRRRLLLSRFGSLAGVAAASEEDLAGVPGISRTVARSIREYFGDGQAVEEDGGSELE
jgi:excinuclease ABC subunit C